LREKAKKKATKAGKTKKEFEAEQKKLAAEAAENAIDEEEMKQYKREQQQTTFRYKVGDDYDHDVAELNKVDYEYEQLLAKAKVKAL